MVKRNLNGKVSRRSANQLAEDIVRQLCDPTVTHWISNGEDEVSGRLISVRATEKGLRLSLDTQRHVTWKCGQAVIRAIGPMLVGRFGWERVANGALMVNA